MRYEQMRVYLAAEELVTETDGLLPLIRPFSPNAAEHLERAVESVLNNVGEALAAWKPRVKIAVLEVSRREANEVRSILRRLVLKKVLTSEQAQRAYNLASTIIAMLIAMAKAIEKRLD